MYVFSHFSGDKFIPTDFYPTTGIQGSRLDDIKVTNTNSKYFIAFLASFDRFQLYALISELNY